MLHDGSLSSFSTLYHNIENITLAAKDLGIDEWPSHKV